MKLRLFLFLLFSVLAVQISYAHEEKEEFSAIRGIIDLSTLDFSSQKEVRLDGEWEFYRNQFLKNEDTPIDSSVLNREYITVPGSWPGESDGSSFGYGTLKVQLDGLPRESVLSLYVPDILCNYKLWVNGSLLSRNGVVGTSRSESRPQFLPKSVSFYTDDGSAEIIIHVSNYNYRNNGIWRSIILGSQDNIRGFREMRIIFETIFTAILLSISLFHIGIFLYRREEKTEFLFGLICLTFAFRLLCTGEQILTSFIPALSWELLRKLEYLPFYASAPLLALFFSSLFPEDYSKIIHRIYLSICFSLGLFVIVTPIRISNNTVPFGQFILIVGVIYVMTILVRALIYKRENALIIVVAYVFFSLTVLNDIFYSHQVVNTMYVTPLGFLIFIIIQSQMLIRKFTRSFSQRELLARSRDKFKHASITDSLTGLFNLRYLHQTLEQEILESIESGKPLSVIMADVDNFKYYNDTWGHKQGDEVLKKMAEIIGKSAREKDFPCRYGGEEFSIILPDTSLEEAAEVAERIRLRCELAEDRDERMMGMTLSIGVARYLRGESVDSIINRADNALYRAKDNGKNCVELA